MPNDHRYKYSQQNIKQTKFNNTLKGSYNIIENNTFQTSQAWFIFHNQLL